jgi:CRISPR/Cas system-associated endonuclease Cas3-HD
VSSEEIANAFEKLSQQQLQRLNLLILLLIKHPDSAQLTPPNDSKDGLLEVLRQFLKVLPDDARRW